MSSDCGQRDIERFGGTRPGGLRRLRMSENAHALLHVVPSAAPTERTLEQASRNIIRPRPDYVKPNLRNLPSQCNICSAVSGDPCSRWATTTGGSWKQGQPSPRLPGRPGVVQEQGRAAASGGRRAAGRQVARSRVNRRDSDPVARMLTRQCGRGRASPARSAHSISTTPSSSISARPSSANSPAASASRYRST